MRRVSPRELQVRLKERSLRLGVLFVLLLVLGGMALMYQGHDAVSQAITKKDGILTVDQVKLSSGESALFRPLMFCERAITPRARCTAVGSSADSARAIWR